MHDSAPIRKAIEMVHRYYLEALSIVGEDGRLIGIFTKSNIYDVLLNNKDLSLPVHTMMVKEVFSLRYDAKIALRLSLGNSKSQVVVVDNNRRPIGLISKMVTVQTLLDHSNVLAYRLQSLVDTMPMV